LSAASQQLATKNNNQQAKASRTMGKTTPIKPYAPMATDEEQYQKQDHSRPTIATIADERETTARAHSYPQHKKG
jgi:hypothetical protein